MFVSLCDSTSNYYYWNNHDWNNHDWNNHDWNNYYISSNHYHYSGL
jgi:hypothetical protein